MKYTVVTEESIFEFLLRLFPDTSRTTIRSWLKHGRVLIQGKKEQKSSHIVQKGQEVELLPKPTPKEGPLKVYYEDEYLIVIDKPAGLLSVAKDTGKEISAHDFVKDRYSGKKVFVVHRLDQDTSGLMMFAVSQQAFQILKEDLKERQVQRVYTALVEGCIEGSGVWDFYLKEDRSLKMNIVAQTDLGAERAITQYKVLRSGKARSLIECKLITGKKNQIRVHASHAGHPIVGDIKYGSALTHCSRLCLHATSLIFCHPITGKQLHFTSPAPWK